MSLPAEGKDVSSVSEEIRLRAPRVVLEVGTTDDFKGTALEEAVAVECSVFGRVLDAAYEPPSKVTVYFASENAAVACGWRLTSVLGSPVVASVSLGTEILIEVDADATAVGRECSVYGRVLDAIASEEGIRVALATPTGAAAAVCALDGTAFHNAPVVARINHNDSGPSVTLRGVKTIDDGITGEFAAECRRYGTVLGAKIGDDGIVVDFATSRQAVACAAAMDGRIFDGSSLEATFRVRGGTDDLDAALANDIWSALAQQPPSAETKKKEPEKKKLQGKLVKAITKLRTATLADPKDEKAKANLAGALLRVGGYENVVEALDYAQAAVELAPKWSWGHFRKGSALLALGEVAKAATSLHLAASLEPENEQFKATADEAAKAAADILDPLDAFVATTVQAEAAKDLVDAADAEKRNRVETLRKKQIKRDRDDDSDDDDGDGMAYNSRAHCYICKQWGHSKRDCPMARCQYCHELGHKKRDCPLFTAALQNATDEEKAAKRKAQYAKKKAKRKEEWTAQLRQQSGIEGFAALYRVLGLPERRLASASDIKKAYHRRSLEYHPDKHPNNRDEAHERFLEIKAAYELLLEGMECGGAGMNGAVFSAGELTDAAAAKALQDKVNNLADKVSKNREWVG